MLRSILLALLFAAVVGCDSKPADPNIEAKRVIISPNGGVNVGPIGGGYNHGAKVEEYKGPASNAPAWAK